MRYWLILFWRERILLYVASILVSGVLLTVFLAHTIILEQQPAQISFAAFYLRSVSILLMLFLIPFYFVRLHQSQEIIHLLTQGRSRMGFLLQTFLAFALLAFIVCSISCTLLYVLNSFSHQTLWWGFSLFLECSIIINWSIFLSTRLNLGAVVSLIILIIYGLGRMHSLMMASAEQIPKFFLKLIPAFDVFTQTEWLLGSSGSSTLISLTIETMLFLIAGFVLATLTYQKRWI